MRSALLILTFAVGAVLLQTTVLRGPLDAAVPDLMLILCVYLGLHHQNVGGALGAFLLGYVLDTFSGTDIGLNASAMTFVFLIVYLLKRRLWIEGTFSYAIVVFVAALLKTGVVAGLAQAFSEAVTAGSIRDAIIGGALAAVLSPFVFGGLDLGKRWLRVPEG
jgi:rod shape-determining protein MreD